MNAEVIKKGRRFFKLRSSIHSVPLYLLCNFTMVNWRKDEEGGGKAACHF
ncbi:hypothetical protein BATR1942_18005 [Bacillus atrophaeus 1942]|uniref:Uncharacterized protein n=1 Tax=Bacillus atrophaeus (strain 1942) TaxID=720555 RepID=A0ABM5M352_BACA1|nr:hypothetical protein BATR1942_18005 [Bacillus atrophaeus 1942]EIM11440.1 hypothetical protein UY9_06810 [Bacillus atrophaeus C89]